MGPYLADGTHVRGRVSQHPLSCSQAGLRDALCALLSSVHCLSYLPEFVDSGERAGPPIVRRAFLDCRFIAC
jgi:hypothetical protein